MKHLTRISLRFRIVLALALGLLLVVTGALWEESPGLSWAAPDQIGDQQTVPPRPPTPDSDPPPAPPPANDNQDKDDDDDDDDENPPAAPPPEQPTEIPSPTQPPVQPIQVATPAPTATQEPAAPLPTASPAQVGETPEATQSGESGGPAPSEAAAPDSEPVRIEEVTSPIQSDPSGQAGDGSGSLAASSAEGLPADLSLSKEVDVPVPDVGQVIFFTVTVFNEGPATATNVVVNTPVLAGQTLKLAAPSQGSLDKETYSWRVGTILPDEQATLELAVVVIDAGPLANEAEIIAVDQADPDSIPGNSLAGEDDQDSAPTKATLQIATASETEHEPGSQDADHSDTSDAPAAFTTEDAPSRFGPLNWLYALGLGFLLILGGVILTRRS